MGLAHEITQATSTIRKGVSHGLNVDNFFAIS